LLSAADYDGTGAVACEMARRGIKVINVATMSNCDQVTYGVNTYDPAVGQKMAEWLGGKNPNAKVVLLSGPAGANWSMERAEGFKKTIAEKYPGIKVLAEKNTDIDPAQAQQVMEDWLTAFPEIDAVIGISDLLGSGASRALQGADRKSKTLVVTSTMSEEAEAGLKSDKLDYVIAERPVLTGRLGTQLAIKALNGEQVKLPDFQPLITVPSAVFYVDQVGYTAADLSNYNSSMDRAPADFNPSKT
ncbi:MAG TPA: sugar ABC transporter substrate-binding protein, partial [Actinomycetes bacterium]|nr:sugar ABC transporter substrate-binding protein [Actinomycetes bacterium]